MRREWREKMKGSWAQSMVKNGNSLGPKKMNESDRKYNRAPKMVKKWKIFGAKNRRNRWICKREASSPGRRERLGCAWEWLSPFPCFFSQAYLLKLWELIFFLAPAAPASLVAGGWARRSGGVSGKRYRSPVVYVGYTQKRHKPSLYSNSTKLIHGGIARKLDHR